MYLVTKKRESNDNELSDGSLYSLVSFSKEISLPPKASTQWQQREERQE